MAADSTSAKITGGNEFCRFAYSMAIDCGMPNNNPRQKPIMRTLPDWWYEIWRVHGWTGVQVFPSRSDACNLAWRRRVA